MHKLKSAIVFILLPAILFAQKTVPITAKSKTEIVNNISQLLLDNYVFPDTAVKMSNRIRQQLKNGAYAKITDPVAFSDALTIDLYSVYHDGHLLVQYVPQETNPAPVTTAATNEDPFKKSKQANFGLQKAEVLDGNIGYLKIDHLWADSTYGKATVKGALQFVSYSNAVIIDLRGCGGGSQETVKIICGYFLDKPTHLNDMYDRAANTTTQYWTSPDPSLTRLSNMPLYILTSNKTFSAAEELCYDLQNLHRATIIGETTGGGAHGTFSQDAGNGFVVSVPYSTAINPVTKTSWETTGVKPEIEVAAGKALETAEMKIIGAQIAETKDTTTLYDLRWNLALLSATNNPVTIDTLILKKFAGVYGERTLTFENGKLFYQRTGRPKFELEAMSATVMKAVRNTYFKVEFVENGNNVDKVNVYYQDNRMESSERTK